METIIFDVKVNTNNAATDVKKVGDSVKGLKTEGENAGKSFTNLRTELKKLNIQLQNLDPASEAFKVAANRAGEIKMAMRDVGDAISDADPEKSFGKFVRGAQAAANGFQIVTAAQGLFGSESKKTQEALLKVQSAMALTQGLSQFKEMKNDLKDVALALKNGVVKAFASLSIAQMASAAETGTLTFLQKGYALAVGTSTGAMKAFRVALVSTGIGALVVGIGMLIGKMMEYMGASDGATRANDRLNASLERQSKAMERAKSKLEKQIDFDKKMAELAGKTDKEINDITEQGIIKRGKLNNKDTAQLEEALKKKKNLYHTAFVDEDFERAKAIQKEIQDLQSRVTSNNDANEDLQKENIINNAQLKKDASDAAKEKAKELKAQNDATAKQNEQAKKEKKAANEQNAKDQLELERKVIDLTLANVVDANLREQLILKEKHKRELQDLKTQYGAKKEFIELEKQLKISQNKELEKIENQARDKKTAGLIADFDANEMASNNRAKAQIENDIRILEKNFQDTQAKKLELETLDFEQKKAAAIGNNAELIAIGAQHAINVEAITEESKNRQIQIDQALFDAKLELANSIGNIFGAISGLFEKNIAAQKAFAIAELAINTATAYVKGLAIAQSASIQTSPFAFPLFYASQVSAILNAVGKAKSILKAGPSVSAPSIPTTKSGGGSNNAITDNNSTDQTSQNVIKVVVLDSDITKQQQQTTKVKAVSTIIG
jgi:hypothetical protein